MKSAAELETGLAGFYGTEGYHRLHPNMVLTDGAKYLAEEAGCFWLYDVVWSVLNKPNVRNEDFLVVKIRLEEKPQAVVRIEDGNDNLLYKQVIPYTDFPMALYTFYIQYNGDFWVVLLTSEY